MMRPPPSSPLFPYTTLFRSDRVRTSTNHSGGIQGGITNGEDIYFRVAFKPVATIFQSQDTVTKEKEATSFAARGRHDPCVLPRAVQDRKSTRLNSSHVAISYAVFCLKKKKMTDTRVETAGHARA